MKLIVDSTADLAASCRGRLDVVPLTIHFGEEEFLDGINLSHREFYERLIESDVLPTTSQPTPDAFIRKFREVTAQGEEAVVLTISSGLSGTYQSACIAAQEFDRKVFVVDSQSVAMGTGILAEYALQCMDRGLNAREVAGELERVRGDVHLIAILNTLEYLQKGGRISKTAAFAGNLLSIKPVLTMKDGQIALQGKARGSRQANNLLVREIASAGGVDFNRPVLLGYAGLNDDLLQKYIVDSAALWAGHEKALRIGSVGSVVGTYSGPDAAAVAFFAKNISGDC